MLCLITYKVGSENGYGFFEARSENGYGKWHFLVWNWVWIWRCGLHTPTKHSKEYPPPPWGGGTPYNGSTRNGYLCQDSHGSSGILKGRDFTSRGLWKGREMQLSWLSPALKLKRVFWLTFLPVMLDVLHMHNYRFRKRMQCSKVGIWKRHLINKTYTKEGKGLNFPCSGGRASSSRKTKKAWGERNKQP